MVDERQSQAEGRQSLLARQPLADERQTRNDERRTLADGRWVDALRTQHGEGQYRDGERRSLYEARSRADDSGSLSRGDEGLPQAL